MMLQKDFCSVVAKVFPEMGHKSDWDILKQFDKSMGNFHKEIVRNNVNITFFATPEKR